MPKLSGRETGKALKNSIIDGTACAVKEGVTGNYLIPLALALGAGSEYIGLLKALPHLVYTLAQPLTAKAINRFKNRRLICNIAALVERLFWIPVLLVPFLFLGNLWWLLFFVCLIYFFNAFTATSWTSWIADLVPVKIRGRFFGKRNMFTDAATFLAALIAGWYLGLTGSISGFAVIFGIAVVFGLVSSYFLYKIPDIKQIKPHYRMKFSFSHFLQGVRQHKNHSNFVIFMMWVNFAVSFVSIFFTVYMLNVLKFSYAWFAVVVAAEMITRIICQRYWGKLADRFDDKRVLKICFIGVPLVPFLWMFANSPVHGVIIGIIAGFFWSGFDLASFNYLLDSTPKIESPTFIANYRFLTGIGNAIGPLLGGFFAVFFTGKTFLIFSGMQILFLIGFILRLMPAVMLDRFHHVRVKRKVKYSDLFLKAVAIYPLEAVERAVAHAVHYLYELEKNIVKK